MTTALWILLAAVLFLIAFNLLRVGVDAEYDGESLFLRVKAGPVKLTILPKKEKPEKPKKKKKAKPTKEDGETPKKEKKSPLTLPTLLKLVRPALEAVGALRRKLSVDLLRLHARVGTSDPCNTAMTFAYLQSAVYGLQPLVERALNVKERDVWLTPDFTNDTIDAEGRLIGTIRIGQIVWIALVLGWKALPVILRQRKKNRERKESRHG